MRYYLEVNQTSTESDKCPICKSLTCRNSPTVKERERSKVLQISREKMVNRRRQQQQQSDPDRPCGEQDGGGRRKNDWDLRKAVAVRNTVSRLEKEINKEIMATFDIPVSMG